MSQDVSIEDQVGMRNGQLVLTRLLINAAVGSHFRWNTKIETCDEGVFTKEISEAVRNRVTYLFLTVQVSGV